MLPQILQSNQSAIISLCQRCKVLRLDVFGSVLRADFAPESDIDFLVRFYRDENTDAFLQYFEFKEGLEAILNRRIDLVCEAAIRNSYFKKEVEATREPLYAA
jgi:predicted nucleotidyltransferase